MADSDVVEAEATPNTEAGDVVTAKTPAVAAKPQEGEAAKASDKSEKKVAAKAEVKTEAKTEAKPDASKDAAKPAETETEPETLVFKDKDGKVISDPVIDEFTAIAKEHKWTPDVANQQLARLRTAYGKLQNDSREKWKAEALADKEIGGDKLPAAVEAAQKAMKAVGVGESYLKTLNETGLGNHVELIKAWAKVWKAVGPDGFTAGARVTGRPGAIENPNDTSVAALSRALYGDAKK